MRVWKFNLAGPLTQACQVLVGTVAACGLVDGWGGGGWDSEEGEGADEVGGCGAGRADRCGEDYPLLPSGVGDQLVKLSAVRRGC